MIWLLVSLKDCSTIIGEATSKRNILDFSPEQLNFVEKLIGKQDDRVYTYESIYSDVKFIHNNELQVTYLICRSL